MGGEGMKESRGVGGMGGEGKGRKEEVLMLTTSSVAQ